MRLLCWSRTDTGRKRDHNEDNFLANDAVGLFAVADGMGGHQGGEHASRMALDVLQREIGDPAEDFEKAIARLRARTYRTAEMHVEEKEESTEDILAPDEEPSPPDAAATLLMTAAARKASSAVFAAALDDPSLRGMGTTLTALLYYEGAMHLCHAGDSRAYLFRDGQITQITEDHSWIQEQIKAGAMTPEEARTSQYRHIITRSVGFERDVEVDGREVQVLPGDCFLLCSDGMSNYVETRELGEIMGRTWYRRLPEHLIDLANRRGGDDNITVVVVHAANDGSR